MNILLRRKNGCAALGLSFSWFYKELWFNLLFWDLTINFDRFNYDA